MHNLATRVKLLAELLGMSTEVDETCYDAMGADNDATWKCVFGDYFLKYQTYPQVIIQN